MPACKLTEPKVACKSNSSSAAAATSPNALLLQQRHCLCSHTHTRTHKHKLHMAAYKDSSLTHSHLHSPVLPVVAFNMHELRSLLFHIHTHTRVLAFVLALVLAYARSAPCRGSTTKHSCGPTTTESSNRKNVAAVRRCAVAPLSRC